MFFATILSLVLLAAVVGTVHAEQRSEPSVAASPRRPPLPRDAEDIDALVQAPLPRAVLGYEPVAVRSRLAAVRHAYTRLAAECDPAVVERAWAGARNDQPAVGRSADAASGHAVATSQDEAVPGPEPQGGADPHGR